MVTMTMDRATMRTTNNCATTTMTTMMTKLLHYGDNNKRLNQGLIKDCAMPMTITANVCATTRTTYNRAATTTTRTANGSAKKPKQVIEPSAMASAKDVADKTVHWDPELERQHHNDDHNSSSEGQRLNSTHAMQ